MKTQQPTNTVILSAVEGLGTEGVKFSNKVYLIFQKPKIALNELLTL